jgi:sarcosine oxidase subunit gamma
MLAIKGEGVYAALERICQLDVSEKTFPVGSVARTQMEHLGVIIIKQENDSFMLMSAASSAENFLHAVVTSVKAL